MTAPPTLDTPEGAAIAHVAAVQTVRREWVDYNGHLRDAYYLLLFSLATDELMDTLGLDALARERSGGTLYTLEARLRFLAELRGGARVRVRTQIVAHDKKRLHLFQTLHAGDDTPACAECEQVLLHVMRSPLPTAAAFAEPVARRVAAMAAAHAVLGRPAGLGHTMGLAPAA